MKIDTPIRKLPTNFKDEEKELQKAGISTWSNLKELRDKELFVLVQRSRASTTNLKKLRAMASLICELDLSQKDAAVLLHAGFSSSKALAASTPQELIQKTGRLERQLNSKLQPVFDLTKANFLIQEARNRQIIK